MNKLVDLYDMLYRFNSDCVFVSESWLYPNIPNSILDPNNTYNIIRSDRDGKIGGGVCAFINKLFKIVELSIDKPVFSDVLAFNLITPLRKYCFVLLYRPPPNSADRIPDAESLSHIIDHLSSQCRPICVVGDLNCKNIDWSYNIRPSNAVDHIFFDLFSRHNFSQCVLNPTRGGNLLDIVCLNNLFSLYHIETLPPFKDSDHDCIAFIITIPNATHPINTNNAPTKIYKWVLANYESMVSYLSQIRWEDILTTNFTVDDIWNCFCSILNYCINEFVLAKS